MPIQKNSDISKSQISYGSLVCFIGAVFYCYEFVLRIIPGVLQTQITSALGHISAAAFGQIAAMYYFAYSPMQMPVGMLMDRFGPRKLLSLACFCCTIGSYLFTSTTSIALVSFGRFLVGFGSSFAFVGVLSLAVHWLPKRYFSLVAGLMTTLGMLGVIYGAVQITYWSGRIGWETVLQNIAFIGLVLSAIIVFFVKDGPAGYQPHRHPLPEFFRDVFKVLTSARVWLIGLIGACLYTSLSVFGELWGKNYLEHVHHLSSMQAATSISAVFLGWAIGAPISGYLSDVSGKRILPLMVGAIGALISISLILYGPLTSLTVLNILLFLYGLFSSTEIIVFIMAKEYSGANLSGTVFAATNMIVTLGGVIFQPLVGTILDIWGARTQGQPIYVASNYQVALSILPLSLILVVLLLGLMQCKSTTSLKKITG